MQLPEKTLQSPPANIPQRLPALTDSVKVPTAKRRSVSRLTTALMLLIYLLPSVFAITYYGLFASDRYVSEATFVVRSATRTSIDGFAALLRMVGVSSSQDDTFAVHDFVASRDAITQLERQVDLRGMYARSDADFLSRYPNLLFGGSTEEFHRYMKNRIAVYFNSNTGISTLHVQAFTSEDAQTIAKQLLELGEQVVNRMNARIRDDAVRFATEEVRNLETRLREIQLSITNFRNQEIQIDPNRSSVLVMELVAKLSDELSRVNALIDETSAGSPNSPQLASLERRSEALRMQIARERARVTDSSDGLAQKMAKFEELNLEREFAIKALASAIVSLDSARSEARRQQLYLERVAGPSQPDKAVMPQRLFEVSSILIGNLVLLLVVWLIRTGITEHAPDFKKGG